MNISFISSGSDLYKGVSPAKERNIPFGIMGAELPKPMREYQACDNLQSKVTYR